MWPFKRKAPQSTRDFLREVQEDIMAADTNHYKIVKYEWLEGRTTYDVKHKWRDKWNSTTDDYGYETLEEAQENIEWIRKTRGKNRIVESVVSEHEIERVKK